MKPVRQAKESRQKKIVNAAGFVLFVAGLCLLFLPHAYHVSLGLEEEHSYHLFEGAFLYLAGLGILIYNNKALKGMKEE